MRESVFLIVFFLAIAWVFAHPAARQCTCGYSVNYTSPEGYAVFTEADEIDFLHTANLSDVATASRPQEYNMTAQDARGPYGKMALLGNVVANPFKNKYDWSGPAVQEGDAGLQLWVRSKLQDGMVPMGEIAGQRMDMWYGSYRVAMKVTGVPGTCGAFFWFHNDTQEIDVEILSSLFATKIASFPLSLVVQSPASEAAGYDASKTPDFYRYSLPFDPTNGFHEYRFDWFSDRVSFYVDGKWVHDMTDNVPDSPGHVILNHWSNGDPKWSAGPPETDAVVTVSYIKAYFNSSDPSRLRAFQKNCGKSGSSNRVCKIPDQTSPPDTGGDSGNLTGRTFFVTKDPIAAAKNVSAYEPYTSGSSFFAANMIASALITGIYGVLAPVLQTL